MPDILKNLTYPAVEAVTLTSGTSVALSKRVSIDERY